MSVATSTYAAHPYAAAPAPHAARRTSRRTSLPPPRDPLPPVPTYAPAPPASYASPYAAEYGYGASTASLAHAPAHQLPAYSRRDRPGADTRAAKASRTAQWVSDAAAPAPAPAGSLAAFGYAIDIGGAPPGYEDERRTEEHEGVIGMTARRQLASDGKSSRSKASSSPPNPAAKAAKSVLRIFGSGGNKGGASEPADYAPLADGSSMLHARR